MVFSETEVKPPIPVATVLEKWLIHFHNVPETNADNEVNKLNYYIKFF